jgi:hypothetical protein
LVVGVLAVTEMGQIHLWANASSRFEHKTQARPLSGRFTSIHLDSCAAHPGSTDQGYGDKQLHIVYFYSRRLFSLDALQMCETYGQKASRSLRRVTCDLDVSRAISLPRAPTIELSRGKSGRLRTLGSPCSCPLPETHFRSFPSSSSSMSLSLLCA